MGLPQAENYKYEIITVGGKRGEKIIAQNFWDISLFWRENFIYNLDKPLNRMASFLEMIFTCSSDLPAFDVITKLKSAD